MTDSRNILLLRPPAEVLHNEDTLTTLAYALQRGIQFVYQVEEGEIAVERIGDGEHKRLLLWEAAEGGTGVWERMLPDPASLASVAWEALRVCHFDPDTGESDPIWTERCAAACYDCLLSFTNQGDYRFLDRFLVRGYLMRLVRARIEPEGSAESYEARCRRLCELADPNSPLELDLLESLYGHKLRLPDRAQSRPVEEVPVQPDFYYERGGLPGACVFVDGPVHDEAETAARDRLIRERLEDLGYQVIIIRYDRPLGEQLARHSEVFSPA